MKTSFMRPEHTWLALAVLALLVLTLAAVGIVVGKHRWAAGTLAELEPRYARLAGLQAAEQDMQRLDEQLRRAYEQLVHPVEGEPMQVANAVLQRVREAAQAHQLNITSSQVLAPRQEEALDRIGLSLRMEGDWPQVAELLGELAAQQPAVFVETLGVSVRGRPADATQPHPVTADLVLFILKSRPA